MSEIRPIRPARPTDPLTAIRGDEVAYLREAITEAQAQVVSLAQRVVDAEAGERHYRDLYRSMLREYAVMSEQRNRARDTAQAIAEQQPRWEAGP